jgi:hypothetical protein
MLGNSLAALSRLKGKDAATEKCDVEEARSDQKLSSGNADSLSAVQATLTHTRERHADAIAIRNIPWSIAEAGSPGGRALPIGGSFGWVSTKSVSGHKRLEPHVL